MIIFSHIFEEHILHLETVLSKLQNANLRLNPAKCRLAVDSTKYLEFIISSKGVETDQDKVQVSKTFPTFATFPGWYSKTFHVLITVLLQQSLDDGATTPAEPRVLHQARPTDLSRVQPLLPVGLSLFCTLYHHSIASSGAELLSKAPSTATSCNGRTLPHIAVSP